MKIVIISEWYSEKMGYAENYLPAALGKLGNEVHLVTSDLQVYGDNLSFYNKVYLKHLGNRVVEQGVFQMPYFTLHRNPHSLVGGVHVAQLKEKLALIRPDIVYCFEVMTKDYIHAIQYQKQFNYKVFSESRRHLSVFDMPNTLKRYLKQAWIAFKNRSLAKNVCLFYPVAPDVLTIMTKYYGVPEEKCKLASLAVNTDIFKPISADEVLLFRAKCGFNPNDIGCLYTGRFTAQKGPMILAKAINHLAHLGYHHFKGLFVGQGDADYVAALLQNQNCQIHPFVAAAELVKFYNAMDIGVWPLQESNSQLDAMACNMPIVLNDKVEDVFRIENNGLTFEQNNYVDLAEKLLSLSDKQKRQAMGKVGGEKIVSAYSWDKLAQDKIKDFNQF
jgi:glycosyltransferase involved in cell wall biosynthesis